MPLCLPTAALRQIGAKASAGAGQDADDNHGDDQGDEEGSTDEGADLPDDNIKALREVCRLVHWDMSL